MKFHPHLRSARSFWIVALTGGIGTMAAAAFVPVSGAVRPAHAFSKQTRAAGAATFHEKGCEHCHGVDGVGTDRGPDLSSAGRRWKKGQIEKQIREGGGGMPPFADALQADEIKDLVDFLSAKRRTPARVPEAPSAAKPPSDDSGL